MRHRVGGASIARSGCWIPLDSLQAKYPLLLLHSLAAGAAAVTATDIMNMRLASIGQRLQLALAMIPIQKANVAEHKLVRSTDKQQFEISLHTLAYFCICMHCRPMAEAKCD